MLTEAEADWEEISARMCGSRRKTKQASTRQPFKYDPDRHSPEKLEERLQTLKDGLKWRRLLREGASRTHRIHTIKTAVRSELDDQRSGKSR